MADIAVLPSSNIQGEQFEQAHVRKIYNEIATSVNDIEHKAWPKVKRFLKKFETGSLIADIGCGNGRYLNINKNVYKIGVDVCCALVDNSRLKGCEVSYADNLHVPLRDDLFDGVVSIGVIHHFCSIERRIKAIQELSRILKRGGKVMLYVWAYEQKHRKFDSQDVLVPWHDGSLGNKRNGSVSSRHSSIGGVSSTSSVSEDDSLDIEEADSFSQNLTANRRKSSLSLDDLASLTELNFKPSYYSLDFSGSPARTEKHGTSPRSREGKNAIVKECRKLEESMRALSANSLDELKNKSALKDIKAKSIIGILSLEGVDAANHEPPNETFLLNDEENGISFLEEEMLEEGLVTFPEEIQYLHIDKREPRSHQGRRKRSRDRTNSSQSAKINPFLKQNSLDSYSFNNVMVSSDDSDSLEDIMEVDSETATQDDVFVEFKPHGNDQTNGNKLVKENSFFGSLKTKLLSIFDNNENDEAQNKECQNHKKNQRMLANNHADSAIFTPEQLSLADQLNFRVREFPQSSCPEILNKQLNDNGYCMVSADPESTLQSHKNSASTYLNSTHTPNNSLHTLYGQIDHDYLNTDPGKMYKLGKAKVHECLVKIQSLDSQISMEDVIYDGFIKLDVEDEKTEETKSRKDALYSNSQAKDVLISDQTETKQETFKQENVPLNQNCVSNQLGNNSQNGVHDSKTAGVMIIKDFEAEEDIISENIKNIQITIPTADLEKADNDNEKDIATAGTDLMNDSGISEREDGVKGKLCRYYHVFREGELEELIASHVPDLKVIHGFYDHANWCVVAEKC